jgi:EmrB/QacA subfamily drug resistance transporter
MTRTIPRGHDDADSAFQDTSVTASPDAPSTHTSPASAPPGTSADGAAAPRPARTGLQLLVMLGAVFMSVLDGTIVNVATSTIRDDLHTTGASLQLVVAGYTIAYAVLLITGARLGGRYGYRRLWSVGVAIFTVASLACGIAPNAATLIAFRFAQGTGAAMMGPQVFSLIQTTFEGRARARALSYFSAVVALGSVVGQLVGGLLITADLFGLGWRPVFLLNVPVGLVLFWAAPRLLPGTRAPQGRKLDLPGLVLLTASVLALVVPLVLGHEESWPAWTKVSLAASAVLFAAFVAVERGIERRDGSPLISGRVLRAPGIALGGAALLFGMSSYLGYLFSLAIHLQTGLHDSAAKAGLVFAPTAVGFATGSLTWQRLPARAYRAMMVIGFLIAAVFFATAGSMLRSGGSGGVLLPAVLLVIGLGMGFAFSPILNSAMAHVAPADTPDASGLLTSLMQLGAVIGVATYGSVFLSLAGHHAAHPTAVAESDTLFLVAGGIVAAAAAVAGMLVVTNRHQRRLAVEAAAASGPSGAQAA